MAENLKRSDGLPPAMTRLVKELSRLPGIGEKTASRLATIDQRRFHFLVQEHPHFATHVMKTLVHRLRHMNDVTCGPLGKAQSHRVESVRS